MKHAHWSQDEVNERMTNDFNNAMDELDVVEGAFREQIEIMDALFGVSS